jgi:uncharacterized protein
VFLSVRELELRQVRFDVEFPPGEIDFDNSLVQQVSPLRAEGTAELLSNTLGEIRIRGTLQVRMESDCDRCLEPVPVDLSNSFDVFYRPAPKTGTPGEVALDEGEAEIGFYQGSGIELGDILREHVLLSLPMQLVCSEDCRGICPTCGVNRNTGACRCEVPRVDDRWAALRELKGSLGQQKN